MLFFSYFVCSVTSLAIIGIAEVGLIEIPL